MKKTPRRYRWQRKFFIVYPRRMIFEIQWPDHWHKCPDNLATLLREQLKIQKIGSEIKLIWNDQHRLEVIRDMNVTDVEFEDYIKSDCSILGFASMATLLRAYKELVLRGAKTLGIASSYRGMILQQAHFKKTGEFVSMYGNFDFLEGL